MTFAKFLTFTLLWTAAAGLLMRTPIHPLAIFFVWIFGFLWGTGYIIGGKADGDALVTYVGGYWAALALVAIVALGLILS